MRLVLGSFEWSELIAVMALFLGVYNAWISNKLSKKQQELATVQNELSKLQLRSEKIKALEMNKADFGARFVSEGKARKLVITNRGKVEARDVRLTFVDGPKFVLKDDAERKFPMSSIDSTSSVRMLASSHLGNREIKEKFFIEWLDDTGRHRKDFDIPIY